MSKELDKFKEELDKLNNDFKEFQKNHKGDIIPRDICTWYITINGRKKRLRSVYGDKTRFAQYNKQYNYVSLGRTTSQSLFENENLCRLIDVDCNELNPGDIFRYALINTNFDNHREDKGLQIIDKIENDKIYFNYWNKDDMIVSAKIAQDNSRYRYQKAVPVGEEE